METILRPANSGHRETQLLLDIMLTVSIISRHRDFLFSNLVFHRKPSVRTLRDTTSCSCLSGVRYCQALRHVRASVTAQLTPRAIRRSAARREPHSVVAFERISLWILFEGWASRVDIAARIEDSFAQSSFLISVPREETKNRACCSIIMRGDVQSFRQGRHGAELTSRAGRTNEFLI